MKKIVGVLVIMLAFAGLVGCGNKARKISVAEYVTMSATGYDGEGYVTVDFDQGAFADKVAEMYGYETRDEFIYDLDNEHTLKESKREKVIFLREFLSNLTVETAKSSGLKNGDTVNCTLSYDPLLAESLNLTVNGEVEPFVVNGLKEYVVISEEEIKEAVKVEVSGVSPKMNANVSIGLDGFSVTLDHEASKLEDGGRVRVDIVVHKESLKSEGKTTERDKYSYDLPIEGNERYVTKPEEIGAELWSAISKEANDKIVSEFYDGAYKYLSNKGKTVASMGSADSVGVPVIKEAYIIYGKSVETSPYNQIVIVYEIPYKGEGYGFGADYVDGKLFAGVFMSDIVADKDGKNEGTLLKARASDGEFDYVTLKNDLITRHMGDYNVVEVPVELIK